VFQSTRLREARLIGAVGVVSRQMFQSTRLREARLGKLLGVRVDWVFQSTRLREARPKQYLKQCDCLSFNPRAYVRRDMH